MDLSRILTFASALVNTGYVPLRSRCNVVIETSSICNLSCRFCPAGQAHRVLDRQNRFIPDAWFHRIIELTRGLAEEYILHNFGEAALNPKICDYMAGLPDCRFALSSNLNFSARTARQLAAAPNLTVACALDVLSPDLYARYRRGGRLETALDNLRILLAGTCRVRVILFQNGEKNMAREVYGSDFPEDTQLQARARAFAREYGIPEQDILMNRMNSYWQGMEINPAPHPGRVCDALYFGLYFNSDGYQVPCCENVGRDLYLRHIEDIRDPADLLNGPPVRAFRRGLHWNKHRYSSCRACPGNPYTLNRLRRLLGQAPPLPSRPLSDC
ncbi:MAG: SPASM domain-containing protein [Magnetococcales bacterium]|nr:SPASM domain-containing protein [Magnetococcales bacterium]